MLALSECLIFCASNGRSREEVYSSNRTEFNLLACQKERKGFLCRTNGVLRLIRSHEESPVNPATKYFVLDCPRHFLMMLLLCLFRQMLARGEISFNSVSIKNSPYKYQYREERVFISDMAH